MKTKRYFAPGAFAYDELDSMIRSPIDENSYFKVAFGHFFGFVYSWMSIFVIKPTQLVNFGTCYDWQILRSHSSLNLGNYMLNVFRLSR